MSGKLPSESVSEEVPLNVLATNSTLPNNPSPTSIGALNGDHQEPNRDDAEDEPRVIVFPDARVDIAPIEAPQPPDHTLRRKLEGKHIFMIAINGTLGTGLYVRSGQILELGGPVAVIMSFIFLGILTWAVMQCIAEMLCLWPIPGAIPVFVRKFVDKELGDTVGVAYWYTYSIGFSALIATSASVLNYWTADVEGFTEGFVFIALPVTLVIINAVKVEIYGWIEVVTGVIKMAFLAIIIICLAYIIINCWRDPFTYDTDAAKGWFEALMMCFSVAIFSYAGIENFAVSVIEARWPQPPPTPLTSTDTPPATPTNTRYRSVKRTLGFTAFYLPIIVAFAYTTSGLLVSLGIKRDSCGLQRLSWLESEECPKSDEDDKKGFTFSPFVIIARSSEIYGLHNAFNAFIVFTALTCANTNLYVASRTLFGVTRNIRSADAMPRVLSWFGVTNNNGVPIRAMTFTALAFCWVPFLQKKETFNTGSDIGEFVEILVQMGSVSIIIIWACLCLAYIRFYHCIHKFDDALAEAGINLARHRREHKYESYPYQSHWQPLLAYLALAGCLVILIVFNGVFLWKKFNVIPFLSGYLTTIVFIAVWLLLKIYKKSWSLWVGLDAAAVEELIKDLNALRDKSLEQPPRVSRPLWVSIKGYFRRET
ncbi:unnamed protein product [Fusarium graminearum]|uniref:Uncharacterized protein n=1 Tax=Gibberella zeae TaxID=5518 RepID=A0A4E9DRU6_GIBZA|nr:hypothetical protein FG05_09152 [Fusarium graminearum]CAF3475242.1 unnamed protein product [Fusarium graminearum]CAG1988018.1 unnamed protein product [Fusarium graminearum]CAG1994926.1 unnamed protein product [Fusarium graminearum]